MIGPYYFLIGSNELNYQIVFNINTLFFTLGTLQVNDPVPKPLRDLQRPNGPGRPLPPTPDDDGNSDTMRRASGAMQRMDSSPGIKTIHIFLVRIFYSKLRIAPS